MNVRRELRQLVTLRPSPGRLPIAIQAGFAMGIPVTAFTLVGRADLGLLASTGAFTALYLANRSRRARAKLLPLIALGLIVCAAIGVMTASSLVASLAVLFVVAGVSATVCLGLGVGPPGALFFVLITGVSGHLAAPARLHGAGVPGTLVVGMLAVGCAIAYLVILAPLAIPRVRRLDFERRSLERRSLERRDTDLDRRSPDLADVSSPVVARPRFDEVSRIIIFRLVLAAGIAVVVSAPLGVHRVYWVLLTVVAILQNGHTIRLTAVRGAHRVLGTLVGVGLFALVALWNPTGLALAGLLALLQFSVELVVIRNYGLALVLITPLALTISAQGHSERLVDVVRDRVLDTLLGAAIAVVVLVVALAVRHIRAGGSARP